jgi:hypothetical protein
VITVELVVRDGQGRTLDLAEVGVDRLVELIRAAPDVDSAGVALNPGSELIREVRMWGAEVLSLDSVERVARQVAAVRAACVGAVADQHGAADRVLDELMTALVVSRRSAAFTREQSEALRCYPEVWAALVRGDIDATRGRIIAEALSQVPRADADGIPRPSYPTELAALRSDGLAYALEHTARRLALYLRRRLAGVGVDAGANRRKRALAQRGVWIAHDGDGTADLTARLASEDAERVYAAIRAIALADRNGDPAHDRESPREPLDLWLAAAFVDAVLGPAGPVAAGGGDGADGHGPLHRVGVETVINVTIALESLAGLTDEPAVLNGFGVLPAHVARRLAAGDARWRHILTCRTSGALLDVGTLSYRPPGALDRHVRLRDGTCRFPGCEVPAHECDLDHLIPFPDGPTSAGNLHALCRRHHGLKHEGAWRVESLPGHGLRWTSPNGATAVTHPALASIVA